MSRINNISGSLTNPLQLGSSQAAEHVRLKIRTVDEANNHWRNITSPTQAEDAMSELFDRARLDNADDSYIDNETYRLLSNSLMGISRAQAIANLPVSPRALGYENHPLVVAAGRTRAGGTMAWAPLVAQAALYSYNPELIDAMTEAYRGRNNRGSEA